jgi:hypothetical protein
VAGIERVIVNMSDSWLTTSGTSQPLAVYINESYVNVTAYDQTQWAKGFISDYKEEFGHVPYINPAPRVKIQYGMTLLSEDRAEGLRRNEVYSTINGTTANSWIPIQKLARMHYCVIHSLSFLGFRITEIRIELFRLLEDWDTSPSWSLGILALRISSLQVSVAPLSPSLDR